MLLLHAMAVSNDGRVRIRLERNVDEPYDVIIGNNLFPRIARAALEACR